MRFCTNSPYVFGSFSIIDRVQLVGFSSGHIIANYDRIEFIIVQHHRPLPGCCLIQLLHLLWSASEYDLVSFHIRWSWKKLTCVNLIYSLYCIIAIETCCLIPSLRFIFKTLRSWWPLIPPQSWHACCFSIH